MNSNIVEPLDRKNEKGTLLVVDGHSLAFRAFFAIPSEKFVTRDGQSTNAIWGFMTMLSTVIESEKPNKLAIAFDVKGGTFRNKMLPQYKGTRDAAPEELISQFPILQELLKSLGVVYVEKSGFEGDDIIATIATMGEKDNYRTLVLSGDRDAFQLIDDHITVLYPGQHFKDLKHMNAEEVFNKYQVFPNQYPDLAALRGEKSDNIPGVPGVGDGYAAKWINQFGDLESIFAHADEITGKRGEALRDNIEQIRLNRKVNALVRNVDLDITIDDLSYGAVDASKLGSILSRLEFGENKKRKIMRVFNYNKKDLDDDMYTMLHASQDNYSKESTSSNSSSSSNSSNCDSNKAFENSNYSELDNLEDEIDKCEVTNITSVKDVNDWFNSVSDYLDSQLNSQLDSDNSEKNIKCPLVLYANETQHDNYNGVPRADSLVIMVDSKVAVIKLQSSQLLFLSNLLRNNLDSSGNNICDSSSNLRKCDELSSDSSARAHNSDHNDSSSNKKTILLIFDALRSYIRKYSSLVVLHDYKKHLALLRFLTVIDSSNDFTPAMDTRLAAYLVEPDSKSETIEGVVKHFFGVEIETSNETVATKQGELDILLDTDCADLEQQSAQESDSFKQLITKAILIRALFTYFTPILRERKQTSLMLNLEMPISRVLRRMEDCGAAVDMNRLIEMRDQFVSDSQLAQNIAWDIAGKHVNLQSPKQVQQILFEDMALKPTRRTKSGSLTTNAEALQELYAKIDPDEPASQFLGALLKHRETNKLKQIVQSLIDAAHYKDGRVHTTYEQTIAATGRLSSVDPNLQNIPNRNAQGREIRAAFVSGEGYESLMSCDYSQVELRIMAHASKDESLIKAFCSGVDFHRYVASMVYSIPMDEVTSDQRTHVKAMSYGLAYGLSTYGLAKQLSIAPREALVLKNKYFATFGKVHDYLESLVDKARCRGYTETMFGRRRYFPQLHSKNRVLRESAERAALNAPIQGTAADIMKMAMIKVDNDLRENGVLSRVILQIHDELVLEIAPGELKQVENIVRNAMEHTVDLSVPLSVSTGVGSDWQLAAH